MGTLARYLVTMAIPAWNGLPLPTFVVNVTGAFLLGALLVALARRGPDTGWRRAVRLFAGTGLLGGFTTYSAFALDTDGLIAAADPGGAMLYAFATVVLGAVATAAGMAVGTLVRRGDV